MPRDNYSEPENKDLRKPIYVHLRWWKGREEIGGVYLPSQQERTLNCNFIREGNRVKGGGRAPPPLPTLSPAKADFSIMMWYTYVRNRQFRSLCTVLCDVTDVHYPQSWNFEQSMGTRNQVGMGYRTGPPGYIGWRASFLGINSWAP